MLLKACSQSRQHFSGGAGSQPDSRVSAKTSRSFPFPTISGAGRADGADGGQRSVSRSDSSRTESVIAARVSFSNLQTINSRSALPDSRDESRRQRRVCRGRDADAAPRHQKRHPGATATKILLPTMLFYRYLPLQRRLSLSVCPLCWNWFMRA